MQARDTSTKRTVLVTGSDKGIGRAVATTFAKSGYTVYMTCMDMETCKTVKTDMERECKNCDIKWMKLDVTNMDSIRECVNQIQKETQTLDILINNAGVFPTNKKPSEMDEKSLRQTFDVNFFGTVHLTQAVLPLMRHGQCKTIINVSTDLGSLCLQNYPEYRHRGCNAMAYHCSKTALNGFTVGLSKELAHEGFQINSVDPGLVQTDMTQNIGDKKPEDAGRIIYEIATCRCGTGRFLGDQWGTIPW
ncbi:short-chain dehydrogenase/reductase (SDR) family protein [Tieghemostelium lacteum]|uniref:Short-chain dehydrogenase/reductase (SDR) family protein n=1 Tax=Tieghemostelium lacteum TaxID=361077 RepID=A0A151ZB19_TIELA|nr:short-chain dehydrogenase/reductase (SDR) family protein [Tieghemostelium lacteum]|eukprot:KYQ91139.1 short-chain dehydrogenase/reductase (SDR) family protein [Tieghemostelium lacteum]